MTRGLSSCLRKSVNVVPQRYGCGQQPWCKQKAGRCHHSLATLLTQHPLPVPLQNGLTLLLSAQEATETLRETMRSSAPGASRGDRWPSSESSYFPDVCFAQENLGQSVTKTLLQLLVFEPGFPLPPPTTWNDTSFHV